SHLLHKELAIHKLQTYFSFHLKMNDLTHHLKKYHLNRITQSTYQALNGQQEKRSHVKYLPLSPHHRSEEHTSELQSRFDLVCRLLLEKKKKTNTLLSIYNH